MIRDLMATWGYKPWLTICAIALVACVVGCVVEMRREDRPW